jgi:hypothetical protein
MGEVKRVNCLKCIYYSVTWDRKYPKGCKFFGFKTDKLPSVTVYESTGQACGAFEQKEKLKG